MASLNSTGSVSSTNVTASSSRRLSGLISGLDTDTLVQQLTMGTQNKINKQMQLKQSALWKQDAYREVISALQEFQDKYFNTSSSSDNIASTAFFNTASLVSDSPYLKVSGSASAAAGMAVTEISQLARQASLTTSYKASDAAVSGGTIQSEWTANAVAGTGLTLTYGGKDYAVKLDGDFLFDTGDAPAAIVDALNLEISRTDGLKGKVSLSLDGDGALHIQTAGEGESVALKDGGDALLKGFGLTKGAEGSDITGKGVQSAAFFTGTVKSGSTLELALDGETYVLSLPSGVSLPDDGDPKNLAKAMQAALNEAIKASDDLKNRVGVTLGEDNSLTFERTGGGSLAVTGGSQSLLKGLGLDNGDGTYAVTGQADRAELVKTHLQDVLAGATLTVSLNGVGRTVTFEESDRAAYADADGVKSYLQSKLNSLYGDGTVSVSLTAEGGLSLSAADPTSLLSVDSSSRTGVLGKSGALRMYAGETNRLNTKMMLSDVGADLNTDYGPLTTVAEGEETYGLKVNGKEYTFGYSTSIQKVIDTINNDPDANVTIRYSSTTDSFSAVAKTGGANSKVKIETLGNSNLAELLFGKDGDYAVQGGQDAKLKVSFDGDPSHAVEISRQENKFTMDGVQVELTAVTGEDVSADKPITFTAESKVDDLVEKMSDFVEDYNSMLTLINGMVSEKKPDDAEYAPLTDAQREEMSETQITSWEKKAKQGLMQGDSLLDSLSRHLRSAMTDMLSENRGALYQIGITSQNYSDQGKLTIDEDKLREALSSDPDKVASMFTGENGIADRLTSVIEDNIKTTGGSGALVRQAGLKNSTQVDQSFLTERIREYNTQIETLKTRLENEQETYYSKFTQLEQYLSTMNTQASWFSSASE